MNKVYMYGLTLRIVCQAACALEAQSEHGSKFTESIRIGADEVTVVVESQPFVPNEHVLDAGKWLIDGRRPIGVDGHEVHPLTEIKSMTISWGGKMIDVPRAAYGDIYSPSLNKARPEPIEKSEGVQILADNEDGGLMIRMLSFKWASAPYYVYWIVSKEGKLMRFVQQLNF